MALNNIFNSANQIPKIAQTRAIDGKEYIVGRDGGPVTGKTVHFENFGQLQGSRLENVPPVKMGRVANALIAVDDKVLTVKNLAIGLKPFFKLAVAGAAGYGVWMLSHLLFGSVMHLNPHLTLALSITAVALIPAAALLLMGMSAYGKKQAYKNEAKKQDAAFEAHNAAQKAVNNNFSNQNAYNVKNPPAMNQYAY